MAFNLLLTRMTSLMPKKMVKRLLAGVQRGGTLGCLWVGL